ncbi:MAG: dihydrofolate reductase [Treponema sp.]|nr:dihydrofolate reductase [Treponema sp.]
MIGLIVARSKNNVIGRGGQIPWRIEGEQKQFKELTTGNIVVMGRRTFEEIGRPLPGRMTIVVSGSRKFEGENLMTVGSLKEALELAKSGLSGGCEKFSGREVFIAGGYGLYKEALPLVDVMYITEVDLVVEEGDTFFPDFDAGAFELTVGENGGEEIKYRRTIYRRK